MILTNSQQISLELILVDSQINKSKPWFSLILADPQISLELILK